VNKITVELNLLQNNSRAKGLVTGAEKTDG